MASCFAKKQATLVRIKQVLVRADDSQKTKELRAVERVVDIALDSPKKAQEEHPCRHVGDLVIALESEGATAFYTLNWKESRYLARALGQDLVVRPVNPEKEDVTLLDAAESWPDSVS